MKVIDLVESVDEFRTTVKVEFKNKGGVVFEVGSGVVCEFSDSHVRVVGAAGSVKMPYRLASKYLMKFKAEPSMRAIERMESDGVVTTPLGNRVEPDGYGPYGDPSWLKVVLGI